MYKSWVSLITYASSRIIYLDSVINNTGPACIYMLNRVEYAFRAPKQFFLDNGGAFLSHKTQLFIINRNASQ